MMTPEEVVPIKRNFSEKRRILTVYVTGGMCLLVTVGWYLVALWLESAALAYVLIPALVGVIALFALIALGKGLLGRVIWMIGTNLSIPGGCFIIARAGRVDLLFLASAKVRISRFACQLSMVKSHCGISRSPVSPSLASPPPKCIAISGKATSKPTAAKWNGSIPKTS